MSNNKLSKNAAYLAHTKNYREGCVTTLCQNNIEIEIHQQKAEHHTKMMELEKQQRSYTLARIAMADVEIDRYTETVAKEDES